MSILSRLEPWVEKWDQKKASLRAERDPWPGEIRADLVLSAPQLTSLLTVAVAALVAAWQTAAPPLWTAASLAWLGALILAVVRVAWSAISPSSRESWLSMAFGLIVLCGGLLPMTWLASNHPVWSWGFAGLIVLNLGLDSWLMFRHERRSARFL